MPLLVVATPIGNLSDLSPRALESLRAADAVVAEDTRHTRGLLTHHGLHKPLLSLPAFDEANRLGPLVDRLIAGETLALVTDAGTPGVSDPGSALVAAAWEAGVAVSPVPGPSAALAAVSASGFDTSRFCVLGFLPRKGEGRRQVLGFIEQSGLVTVLFEAGNRIADTLAELASRWPTRRALLARELTKLHEELVRAPLPELAAKFAEGARGEVALVLDGAAPPPADAPLEPLEDAIRARLAAGAHVKEVARALADAYGLPRQEVYARAVALRAEGEGGESS